MPLTFDLLAADGQARRGRLTTPHGVVETPAFMPVGTLGAVKGVTPQELEAAGASVMLANLYHLALRPGVEAIERLGGLHAFTGWRGPILTDSGGFQVWSLGGLRTVDSGGVTFRSHLDGSPLRFTPEDVVGFQERMGVDVAMVLDECTAWPVERAAAEASWERTLAWARRARAAWRGDRMAAGCSASSRGASTRSCAGGRRRICASSTSTATPSAASRWASRRPSAGRWSSGRPRRCRRTGRAT